MQPIKATNECIRPETSGWTAEWLRNGAEVAGFAARARERLPIIELNHDVEWLEAGCRDGEEIVAIAEDSAAGIRTAMPVKSARGAVAYTAGTATVFKVAARLFDVVQQPVTIKADERTAYVGAMRTLAGVLPKDGVVVARAVQCGSAFGSLLDDANSPLRDAFHVLPWGGVNWHCKIEWTGSVEAYLSSLGADSRRNFKRYSKKLFEQHALAPDIKRFQTPDEVTQFLKDGIQVSDKTYQKNLLGLGLSRGGPTERRFRFAAERRGFLGHILYLNGAPAAFHYGFVFGATFFVVQMGYDPALAQHQPGAVLFFHVLQDVERLKLPVKTIDCLPGVTDFKLRTTNRKQQIRNYYLFPRTMRGALTFAGLSIVDAGVRAAKALAARLKPGDRAGAKRRAAIRYGRNPAYSERRGDIYSASQFPPGAAMR